MESTDQQFLPPGSTLEIAPGIRVPHPRAAAMPPGAKPNPAEAVHERFHQFKPATSQPPQAPDVVIGLRPDAK